jgi:hypothetical protein
MLPPGPSVLPIPVVTTPGMVRPGVLPRVAGVVTPSPSVVLIPAVPPVPTVLPVVGAPMPIAGAGAVPPNWGNIGLVGPVGAPPDPASVLNPFPKIPGFVRPLEVPPDPPEELKP